jgi:hypothetical protein
VPLIEPEIPHNRGNPSDLENVANACKISGEKEKTPHPLISTCFFLRKFVYEANLISFNNFNGTAFIAEFNT